MACARMRRRRRAANEKRGFSSRDRVLLIATNTRTEPSSRCGNPVLLSSTRSVLALRRGGGPPEASNIDQGAQVIGRVLELGTECSALYRNGSSYRTGATMSEEPRGCRGCPLVVRPRQ